MIDADELALKYLRYCGYLRCLRLIARRQRAIQCDEYDTLTIFIRLLRWHRPFGFI